MPTRFPTSSRGLAAVAALALTSSLPSTTHAEAPQVRAVTLSTAGLALVETVGQVGAEPLRLLVPRDEIDDFLKSLVVLDSSGASPVLRLGGPDALKDTFARLPFGHGNLHDPVSLLAALPGAPVLVERRGERWEGRVLGVGTRTCEHGPCPVLSIDAGAGRIMTFEFGDALEVTLTDPLDQARVAEGLDALRAAGSGQQVPVEIGKGGDAREIGLVWLQRAPVWRTAWRAVDTPEGLQLTGWAVLENTTGSDWNDIALTLATGAVRALDVQLYARRWAQRERAEDMMFAAPAAAMEIAADAAPMQRFMSSLAQAPGPVAIEADDGVSFSRFTLSEPVTLPAGQVLSVPFLRETLGDARITYYDAARGEAHPKIALRLTNPLPLRLPAGVVTLYEDGRGHAGDAMIPEMAPGATETVTFATDTAMKVLWDDVTSQAIRDIRISGGLLILREEVIHSTNYRIEGAASADRLLVLSYPRHAGWELAGTTRAAAREMFDAFEWEIEVHAGATVTHQIERHRMVGQSIQIGNLGVEDLIAWQGRSPSPEVAERLGALAELRRLQTAAEDQIRRIDREAERLEAEQTRLVALVVQLGDDSSANRDRRARIDAIDGELAQAAGRRDVLETEAAALAARFAEMIRN